MSERADFRTPLGVRAPPSPSTGRKRSNVVSESSPAESLRGWSLPTENAQVEHLLRAYHERGDVAARERLVELHLPLVKKLARSLDRGSADLDDLVQVGSIGLIKAIDRFEFDRGGDLGAFAVP